MAKGTGKGAAGGSVGAGRAGRGRTGAAKAPRMTKDDLLSMGPEGRGDAGGPRLDELSRAQQARHRKLFAVDPALSPRSQRRRRAKLRKDVEEARKRVAKKFWERGGVSV